MFSGIVEQSAEVASLSRGRAPFRLVLNLQRALTGVKVGDSVCVSGVCLTVVAAKAKRLEFDMVQETVHRSTLGRLKKGARVNIERSLKLGDRIHGHFVFGHVDGTARLRSRLSTGKDAEKLVFAASADLLRYFVCKGSVAVNGVSLTLGEISEDSFAVYIVPHTLAVTNLSALKIGELVNIEVDMLARYAHSVTTHRVLTHQAEEGYAADSVRTL